MKYIDDVAAEADKIIADYLTHYNDNEGEEKEIAEVLALKLKEMLVLMDDNDLVEFLLTILLGEGVSAYVEREANLRSKQLS